MKPKLNGINRSKTKKTLENCAVEAIFLYKYLTIMLKEVNRETLCTLRFQSRNL